MDEEEGVVVTRLFNDVADEEDGDIIQQLPSEGNDDDDDDDAQVGKEDWRLAVLEGNAAASAASSFNVVESEGLVSSS
jgi:hypothetical protein